MPYISLDNLTQYNGRLRDYIDGSFDKLDGANWRKTPAGQSVSCWPIPESPLEPEVAFKFSEVPPASGDKGPDNPSTIVGVESVSCNVCESEGVSDTPYSIDLGDTYYGGSVDLSAGTMTVTHKGYVFDGTEAWSGPDDHDGIVSFGLSVTKANGIGSTGDQLKTMTHFPYIYSAFDKTNHFYIAGSGTFLAVYTSVHSSTKQEFTSWLSAQKTAGTPVKLVYHLDQPYTVPLTPVLVRSLPALSHYAPRQNTIYTPHESVQVGYAKSASKTSQDLANAIVALGGNV